MSSTRDILFGPDFLARLEQLHLLAKRIASRGAAGLRRSRKLGDGLEFADHRDYASGDDIRFIDWPYYARMEKLLLRLFHEHSDADVVILFDASGSMLSGNGGDNSARAIAQSAKYVYELHVAAALAYVAMGSLERVTLLPFGEELGQPFRTARNRLHILEVLDFLASVQPSERTDLRRSAEQLAARHDPAGTVLLLSDLLDCGDQLSDALARLRMRSDTAVMHIYSPADAQPSLSGAIQIEHAETNEKLNLSVTPDLLASYAQRWKEFQSACERTALSRGATYVAALTSLPFEQLILQTLRRSGVLE